MKNFLLLLMMVALGSGANAQCQANFSTSVNGSTATFTNTSTGTNISYYWSFGDGTISSQMNPSHTYTTTGSYGVCLTVYSNDSLTSCQNTTCDSLYVIADSTGFACDASANVSVDQSGTTIEGTNTSSGGYFSTWDVYNDNWTWIHSTSSTNLNYTPAIPGTYNVCLTVYDSLQMPCDTACYTVVTIQDSTGGNGCDASAVVTVNPNGTIIGTATSSEAMYFYWAVFNSNGNVVHSSGTNPLSYNSGIPGVYSVCLTTYDSLQFFCDSTCYLVATDSTAGLNAAEMNEITVYPNPASDQITVVSPNESIYQINLVDVSGSLVRFALVTEEKTLINLEQLPEGMYFIHALGREGQQLSSCKIIKR